MKEQNVEVQDIIEAMRKQLSTAMYEAAVNHAVAAQLRKRVSELEKELEEKSA